MRDPHIELTKVRRTITTSAANAGPNLVSIGPVMVRRKARAGLFPEMRQKRYEKWLPSHREPEEHPKNDEQKGEQYPKGTVSEIDKYRRYIPIAMSSNDQFVQPLGIGSPS